jgi:hypothetical protein
MYLSEKAPCGLTGRQPWPQVKALQSNFNSYLFTFKAQLHARLIQFARSQIIIKAMGTETGAFVKLPWPRQVFHLFTPVSSLVFCPAKGH